MYYINFGPAVYRLRTPEIAAALLNVFCTHHSCNCLHLWCITQNTTGHVVSFIIHKCANLEPQLCSPWTSLLVIVKAACFPADTFLFNEMSTDYRPACRFFQKGQCIFGDGCKFRHVKSDAPAVICRFYLLGVSCVSHIFLLPPKDCKQSDLQPATRIAFVHGCLSRAIAHFAKLFYMCQRSISVSLIQLYNLQCRTLGTSPPTSQPRGKMVKHGEG